MNIYVGNLSFKANEEDVRAAFGEFGTVASVEVIKDRFTGKSRGFAFVDMPNAPEASAAIAGLNGKDLLGRALTVNEARPRSERPQGGGSRGGFGGGERRGGPGGGNRRDFNRGGGERRDW